MKLLDLVASCRQPIRVNLPGGALHLAGASRFAGTVAEAQTRWVLRDDIRDACREIAGSWAVVPAPKALSVPVGETWLEWQDVDEDGRPRRAALLIRAGQKGRCGTIHAFCEDDSLGAELALAYIRFDLDHREPPEQDEDPEICLVAPYATLMFQPDWVRYFALTNRPRYVQAAALRRCAEQVLPQFELMLALFQLLHARRDIAERRVDRRALNRARLRKGQSALLDHVEMSLARKGFAGRGLTGRRGRVQAPLAGHGLDRLHEVPSQARA